MEKGKYILGIDLGSSSVKSLLLNADTGLSVVSAKYPEEEMQISAPQQGWAEQDPEMWWANCVLSIRECMKKSDVSPNSVFAIGISYQMHGLVMVGEDHKPLRSSIIWCDSRAVNIGNKALRTLGEKYCQEHLLNSPGNFTASKLRWIRENEPDVFEKIHKVMLPGDYIAMKITGEIQTTETGFSEGVMWDFKDRKVSARVLENYQIPDSLLADVVPVFSVQGRITKSAAVELGLNEGIVVAYRAGDQPNNAFSLNVLNPGETAATAGTSGVIYTVTDKNAFDQKSRVNTFLHVNNLSATKNHRNGVLLCINGTGSMNSWLRKILKEKGTSSDYGDMNKLAATAPIGSDGLSAIPFGNGAERILENKNTGSAFHGLNFNRHSQAHLLRAAQEGIVFAMKYGFDILSEMEIQSKVIRVGNANMFLSPLFREAFVNTIGVRLELYDTDGAKGAALGAGIGTGFYKYFTEAFNTLKMIRSEKPSVEKQSQYLRAYQEWLKQLDKHII